MLKITVNTNLPAQVNRAIAKFDQKQAALLQEIGQTVLSLQKLDFEVKGRGGAGADGVAWAPLAESTIMRKEKRFGDAQKSIKKLNARLAKTTSPAVRKSIKKLIKSISSVSTQIGVDTGIMRNCVTPGYRAPDGDGGNILEVNGSTVTVGYAREYAEYFDQGHKKQPGRPLMPDVMPEQWMTAIEKVVTDWASDIVAELER